MNDCGCLAAHRCDAWAAGRWLSVGSIITISLCYSARARQTDPHPLTSWRHTQPACPASLQPGSRPLVPHDTVAGVRLGATAAKGRGSPHTGRHNRWRSCGPRAVLACRNCRDGARAWISRSVRPLASAWTLPASLSRCCTATAYPGAPTWQAERVNKWIPCLPCPLPCKHSHHPH